MRAASVLFVVAAGLVLVPLVWALLGSEAEAPRRIEVFLVASVGAAAIAGVAAFLRARAVASWPRVVARIERATQTGAYQPGLLAIEVEVSHPGGRAVGKARVPAAEVARWTAGAAVTLAVDPADPRRVEVVGLA